MKNLKHILGTLLLTALVFTSCSKNDNDELIIPATAQEFDALKEEALTALTQTFQFNAEDGSVTFTSEKGVEININGACLTKNGDAVTGAVELEFIELFDKGNMLTTNKPTMGILPSGDKALLISGGEFFVQATQNGIALDTNCAFQMIIPADLTGGIDNDMILWNGIIDDNGDLAWAEDKRDGANGQGGVFAEGNQYYGFFQSFGWSNVDRFYSDPRPKTTILVGVPTGYNNTNSSVYLSYDGEDSGLAGLDTYDAQTGLFSEHYGQIPIGLECHVIFATEEDGNWKYAIKAVTIVENGVITFTEGETSIATEAQLTTIINGLP
ncbi:hypothetical protein [Confluentibacter flavum]|uniref:Uncharacterized protein n=1 Tax=Confluentibacter flavum TaxID=1909700 RepID=A0A2N3HPF0_9FLAO|nr:hypothetical protein [Confluentibacter flavum]PKQ46830.1 hypothetical protein CSW08_00525 [Confluentibacter flavum]